MPDMSTWPPTRRWRAACLTIPLVVGCASTGRGAGRNGPVPSIEDAEDGPTWRTEEGRLSAWRQLAAWYIDNGLSNEALGMVERIRAASANTPDLDVIQARALLAQGLPSEAKGILEMVTRGRPGLASAWQALGVAYVDLEQYEDGVSALERALRLDATHTATRNNLGFLLYVLGRCPEAVEQLEQVVAEDGTKARYRNNLAFSLVCAGEPKRALDLLRSVHPEAEARYNLGVAYEHQDKATAAVLQYQQAVEIDPDHDQATEALARLAHLTESPSPPGGP